MNRRSMIILAGLALAGAGWLMAAEKAVVGTWQVTSDSPGGEEYRWTLTVKQEDGKLSGTLSGSIGQFELQELKAEGETFSCKITVGGDTYSLEGKVSGDKLEGTWKGAGAQGVIKGTKQS